jgi:hypothetical protein
VRYILSTLDFAEVTTCSEIDEYQVMMRSAGYLKNIECCYLAFEEDDYHYIVLQCGHRIFLLGNPQKHETIRVERILLERNFTKISLAPYITPEELDERRAMRN